MTVVVAFHCSNGVVLAADSMITPSMGGLNVGHHHGKKVEVIAGPQLFAFAGDQGQAARFRIMAELNHTLPFTVPHPIDFGIQLSAGIIGQLGATGVSTPNVNTVLAFAHGGTCQCCVFEGLLQPRLLDSAHYYVALGSGKLSADPFLRFMVDTFCPAGQPSMREAVFLATWVIQHVIDTNSGGVAGPIRIATFEITQAGAEARELPEQEIAEHQQAIESATESLRNWRDALQSGSTAGSAPALPAPPKP